MGGQTVHVAGLPDDDVQKKTLPVSHVGRNKHVIVQSLTRGGLHIQPRGLSCCAHDMGGAVAACATDPVTARREADGLFPVRVESCKAEYGA